VALLEGEAFSLREAGSGSLSRICHHISLFYLLYSFYLFYPFYHTDFLAFLLAKN